MHYLAFKSDVVSAVLDRRLGPEKSDRRVCYISGLEIDGARGSWGREIVIVYLEVNKG